MEIVAYRSYDTDLYRQGLTLRNELLRKPLGKSIYDDDLAIEQDNLFFGAVEQGKLLGTLGSFSPEPGVAQLTAFAVRADRKGQGIGASLVKKLLGHLKQEGFSRCVVM